MAKDQKFTSEVQPEKQTSEVQESPKAGTISLDDYLKKVAVYPGLIASFKVEKENDFSDKTEEDWAKAFEVQSNRVYNY